MRIPAASGAGEGDRRALGCLARISAKVNSTEDPAEALQHIMDEVVATLRASSASIALVDPDTGTLRIEASKGLGDAAASRLRPGQGITGWVAVHAKPLRVSDVRTEPRYRMLRPEVRSELAVPMSILGQVVGVVNCDSDRPDAFGPADEELLTLVTAEAAKAVGRLWMLGQLRSKTRQLEAILAAGQEIVRDRDEPRITADLARHTRALLGFRAVAVYAADGASLVRVALDGDLGPSALAARLDAGDTALGTVAARLRPLEVTSAGRGEEQLFTALHPDVAAASLLLMPVAHGEEGFAVLVGIADGPRRFSDDERRVLSTVVAYAALALRNARLYAKAFAAESELRKGERLTALGMLSAEIAHEIRNPLTVMRLLTDTLGEGMAAADARRQDLEVMREKVAHMEGVVSRVLSLARSQSGAFRPVDLAALARQAVLMMRLKLEQAGVSAEVAVTGSPPRVAGDPGQLHQVFLNLLMNALQAMPAGGTLRIELTAETGEMGPVAAARVSDTGGGIPPDIQPRIFESFFTGREDGTGLGLAIVSRILRAHRGDIAVESTGPAGTAFRFWVPADS
jgi:signal transduction histidine kinase